MGYFAAEERNIGKFLGSGIEVDDVSAQKRSLSSDTMMTPQSMDVLALAYEFQRRASYRGTCPAPPEQSVPNRFRSIMRAKTPGSLSMTAASRIDALRCRKSNRPGITLLKFGVLGGSTISTRAW